MNKDLTLHDLARITGRHVETLRRLARMNQLVGVYRLGRRWLISKQAADRLRRVPKSNEDHAGQEPARRNDTLGGRP